MKKVNRIVSNREFNSIINRKKKTYNSSFTVYYTFKKEGKLKVGISVSKKNFKTAVLRNKIKRQVRAMCDEIMAIDLNVDIVIIVSKNYLNFDYKLNKENLNLIYKKIISEVKTHETI